MKTILKNLKINSKLEVRNTNKYGQGVFARVDINKGEIIHVLKGKKMTLEELVAKVNRGDEMIDDPLQVGKKNYIDLDHFSRIFNHSCNPNAGLRKRSELFALKKIKKGTEIAYDYSATVAPTQWKMKCKCGAKNCRKILGDVLTIPKNQLKRYMKMGSIQNYMKAVLKSIRTKKGGANLLPKYEINALNALNNKK